jgi:hypothetical protein
LIKAGSLQDIVYKYLELIMSVLLKIDYVCLLKPFMSIFWLIEEFSSLLLIMEYYYAGVFLVT